MIGNVIRNHLPMKNIGTCETCIHWKDSYHNPSYSDPDWMAGYCKRPSKDIESTTTGEDWSCIHWEGEQRTGDEVV